MKKTGLLLLVCLTSIIAFANSLTIVLEDSSVPCVIYVNGISAGEVKDSLVMTNIKAGTYKVSMFSEKIFDKGEDSLITDFEKKAKSLDEKVLQDAVKLGTETAFLSDNNNSRVKINNKAVNDKLKPKGKSNTLCCCLGGGGGCCLGVLAVSTLMVWWNNQYVPQ